jgi:hypothetical protein
MPRTEGDTGSFDLVFTSTSTWPWLAPTITTSLTEGVWKDDEITSADSGEKWYTFTADTGTYRTWVNDGGSYVYYGDGTKTLDVQAASWKTGGTSLFSNTDALWSSPQNLTPLTSGDIVYIRIRPYSSGNTGTYGIVYTKDNAERPLTFPLPTTAATPLTADVWRDGSITSGTEAWYSITLSATGYYNLWWNDSAQGNGSKTLDVVIGAWFENGDRVFESIRIDGGWTSRTFYNYSSATHTTMYIKVSPKTAGETGTFAIAYHLGSSSDERPWLVPTNPTSIIAAGQWTNGSIAYDGEVWFSFTASVGTYYFWKNGYYEDGTKDANINITPYTASGTPTMYNTSEWDG